MQGNTQMINIAICDDDVAMTATIEKMLYVIAKEQNIKISSAVFFDGSTLVANIRQGVCYDLIYLDIEMHNVNGINAAELIRNMEIPALIIYVSSYEKYLKEQQICNNTISFYMRNLRAIYNRAVEESYTEQKHPFKKVFVGNDKTIKRAIDEDVISRLKTLDLSSKPRLAFSRDMFMFSFYARGMAFIDLAYLTKENIQGEYIIYRRHKTGQELSIKLEICLKTIIDRYSHNSNGTFLFPILSESTQNYDSALRLHNIHLKKISGFMGLPKPLTSYVARHSWATLAKKKGISTQIISESMGHNSEKTTRIYLSSLDRSVIADANAKLISGI